MTISTPAAAKDTTPSFLISPSPLSRGLNQAATAMVTTALVGGAATAAFFTTRNQLYYLIKGIQQETVSWISTTTSSGQPAYFAQLGSGASAVSLTLTAKPNSDALGGKISVEQTQYNGQTYNLVGSMEMSYSAGDYGWTTELFLKVAEQAADLVADQFAAAVVSVLQGVKSLFGLVDLAGTANVDAGELDAKAVESAEGEDTVAAFGSFTALAVSSLIMALLQELLHYTQHNVTIINMTGQDVTWATPFLATGTELTLGPVMASGSGNTPTYVTNNIIAGAHAVQPAYLNLPQLYGQADLQFSTATQFTGLGEVFTLSFTDAGSGQAYTATVAFTLPWSGENLLTATFDQVNPADFYAAMDWPTGPFFVSAGSADKKYLVTATYDYLSGQHQGPGDAGTGYFYNSLIVIQPAPVSAA